MEQDFVVSRPFVYFVMDIHTKVSLIAGVITDPLAAPIWIWYSRSWTKVNTTVQIFVLDCIEIIKHVKITYVKKTFVIY